MQRYALCNAWLLDIQYFWTYRERSSSTTLSALPYDAYLLTILSHARIT